MNNNINYIQAVEEALKNAEINYHRKERKDSTTFFIPFRAENLPAVNVAMRVEEDGDVKLSVFPIKKVADRFRGDVLEIINEFNTRYRFTCFALDSDGDVRVDYDVILVGEASDDFADKLSALLMLFSDIVDETYIPLFLAARCGLKTSREVSARLEAGGEENNDEAAEDENPVDSGALAGDLESLLALLDAHCSDSAADLDIDDFDDFDNDDDDGDDDDDDDDDDDNNA